MNFKASFKLPNAEWIIHVDGKAKSKKEFLNNCKKHITPEHKLIRYKRI